MVDILPPRAHHPPAVPTLENKRKMGSNRDIVAVKVSKMKIIVIALLERGVSKIAC